MIDIFDERRAPTVACHASTIAQSGGTMITAWFGGTREKHPDVGIWTSRLEADAWSAPVEVANGERCGRRSPCWNPVLFQPDAGPLMLFYKIGDTIATWQTHLKLSFDHGVTWSEARNLGDGIRGPVKNKPVQLQDGTILCGSSNEPSWREWRVYFSSTCKGEDWQTTGPWNDPNEFQAIQPALLTHLDGRLQALCRTRQGCISQLFSEDQGATWSTMTASILPNPNAGIDALTLADGRHLLVYNHTNAGRSPLNVAVSNDGIDWKMIRVLESEAGEYSYPAVIQSQDGTIHITYTRRRKTIGYARLDEI